MHTYSHHAKSIGNLNLIKTLHDVTYNLQPSTDSNANIARIANALENQGFFSRNNNYNNNAQRFNNNNRNTMANNNNRVDTNNIFNRTSNFNL